ncbi:hypothetical protein Rhe02_47470 [Rhizocola hellebori]|uniref:Uncharacterized protein n=1 Tax=Rhizocola hellebori TaxID=1392758 RepID=A0A8J3QBS8_9ACTN|nr:hypothetical protein Rhe02_47470 [Rhizocola hellebori]
MTVAEFFFEPERVAPALEAAQARFEAVAQRVQDVYGLILPRHMAVFAAFLDSIGSVGERALSESAGVRSGGITRYFEPEGLALTGRDGMLSRRPTGRPWPTMGCAGGRKPHAARCWEGLDRPFPLTRATSVVATSGSANAAPATVPVRRRCVTG